MSTLNWNDLILNSDRLDAQAILEPYRWKLPQEDFTIQILTKLGDCFLSNDQGQVFWLNTAEGMFLNVAKSVETFRNKLKDSCQVADWFLPHLIVEARKSGLSTSDDEVISYRNHPALGGNYRCSNLTTLSVNEHFEQTGKLHYDLRHFPPGKIG